MKVRHQKYKFELNNEDIKSILNAISMWKSKKNIINNFDGAFLLSKFEEWEEFVDSEWSTWDISEYRHDLDCRFWLQIAIEYSTSKTSLILNNNIKNLDDKFKNVMKLIKPNNIKQITPFKQKTYFWQTHSIHPEQ